MALFKDKKGTIRHASSFNASKDAEVLRKAMKGIGTDEKTLLERILSVSNHQRQEIALAYKTEFGRDLVEDLKSELSGTFEKLLVALMIPSSLYDAYELRNAIKGFGTSDQVLIEILASRTCSEISGIKREYQKEYERELESDITGDTCGPFEKLLVVLVQANREPDGKIHDGEIEQDAKDLFDAGENKWGTDEEKFIRLLGSKPIHHLRRVFEKYMTISGYQIEESIERETSGHFKELMLAVVKCIRSIQCYLAEVLYKAMKGAGTDEHTLIRVMVSRSEVDLWDIRQEFRKNHGQSLHSMINDETSGDFRQALLLLCGGDDH